MAGTLTTAPVLSTPNTHIFEDPTPPLKPRNAAHLSDEEFYITYEIGRTVGVISQNKWRRIALQFPDEMLPDGPRVFAALERKLRADKIQFVTEGDGACPSQTQIGDPAGVNEVESLKISEGKSTPETRNDEEKLFILADTSYGACCVDEITAEHISADVVVHYGRSCLSPTARLPVIYVFTTRQLSLEPVVDVFRETFPNKEERVVLMADVTYASHVQGVHDALQTLGYSNTYATSIVHDPGSLIPNRTIPPDVREGKETLNNYQLFHISDPPTSLLLTLSSRLSSIYIYPTDSLPAVSPSKLLISSTAQTLRRRYALITSLTTVPIFGILINTLSVANYLHIVSHVKSQLLAAGKKSYTFVVGKVNAAKIANFSEIGGWVVIGCWESSLIESKDFYRPIITPWELGLVLRKDGERVWTGEWVSDFNSLLSKGGLAHDGAVSGKKAEGQGVEHDHVPEDKAEHTGDIDTEPESAPPEFDLRTGRYVSHSRPMQSDAQSQIDDSHPGSSATLTSLVKRAGVEIASVGGEASPGAEYLRSERTWQGLGSDFEIKYEEEEEGAQIQQGRGGIARGYTTGKGSEER